MSDTTTLDRPNQAAPDQPDVPPHPSPIHNSDVLDHTDPPLPDNPNQRTIDCLRRAQARILEQDQVRQNAFSHDNLGFDGRLCTSAALAYGEGAPYAGEMMTASHRAVSVQLASEEPKSFYVGSAGHICDWNNEEGRTVQDVADLFQRTIDRLERAS